MSAQTIVGALDKGDCRVTVTPDSTLKIEIKTKASEMLAEGIEAVVQGVIDNLPGLSPCHILVEEFGSLDYVIGARTETALRRAFPALGSTTPSTTPHRELPRDRLRRTRLYCPGNNPRLLVGCELHGADVVLLDLEDSVPPVAKGEARILVKHMLGMVDFPEVWVRINPLNTYGLEDIPEVLRGRPDGICLPKAEGKGGIQQLSELLAKTEKELGIPEGTTKIIPIVETARGVLRADEIAGADERVIQMAFGAEDYTRDVGASRTWDALLYARSAIVAACKANRIQASDTVFSDLEDEEGLVTETRQAKSLGFDGKGVINPRQVAPIHKVFDPTPAEIEYARKVVEVAEEAQRKGLGAIAMGGKMIDQPVLERARRILKLASMMRQEVTK